jgi:hypothetical protein
MIILAHFAPMKCFQSNHKNVFFCFFNQRKGLKKKCTLHINGSGCIKVFTRTRWENVKISYFQKLQVNLIYGVKRHFQQYFSYIVAVSFIGGEKTFMQPLPTVISN